MDVRVTNFEKIRIKLKKLLTFDPETVKKMENNENLIETFKKVQSTTFKNKEKEIPSDNLNIDDNNNDKKRTSSTKNIKNTKNELNYTFNDNLIENQDSKRIGRESITKNLNKKESLRKESIGNINSANTNRKESIGTRNSLLKNNNTKDKFKDLSKSKIETKNQITENIK